MKTSNTPGAHLVDAWHTIAPPRGNPYGPLPPLLVLMTMVTGLVDAFSYLQLGHVFVANMTGNVVFLSFALGGAPGFLWWASLLAIFAFVAGAFLGGRIAHTHGRHRGRHLLIAAAAQTVFVLASFVLALLLPTPYSDPALVPLIVLLGVGMGLQNATARALAVPDLTTTVLTLTITGISADSSAAGGTSSKIGRRLVSITGMFLGGLIGVLLIEAHHGAWVLLTATVLLAIVTAVAAAAATATADWTKS
jgi:uncharacterized membrane protein YoaK (UPF0700 family)